MGIAANKFNKDSDNATDALSDFDFNAKGFSATAEDYTKGIDGMTKSTLKLTGAELAAAKASALLLLLQKKFGLKGLKETDPITLEAIRKNQIKQQKLGISSPTISLAASAGHGNIAKNTTMNGGNITVNVAGSVVSEGDLVSGILNGLEVIYRRRGGSSFAVL